MSFNFTAPKTITGFTLPTATTTATSSGGFQFGGAGGDAKSTKPAINLTFTPQQPASTAPLSATTASTGFSLTAAPAASAAPQFGFAAPATTSAPQFSFTPASGTTAPAPQFSFTSTTATAPQFSFTATTTTATPPQFSFAATSTTAAPPQFSFTPASATTTSALQFNLGPRATATTTTPASTALSFALGATTSTPSLLGASVTTSTPAVTSSVFSLTGTTVSKQITTTASTIIASASTTPSVPTSITSATSIIPSTPYAPSATISYSTLEDLINKWTIYLEDETKHFTNQAKQMNAWDRLLITNSEKILYLSNGIERVKQLQEQLDQELDFVVAQQKELLDLIEPLEKELADIPLADMDRHRTYQIAETLDTELKQMSEDLKEIIEHLNESNKHQELANPMYQIGSILNVHMNSLQWIDRQITKITTHLDQISKMHDMNKRNHEINLQKTYE